MTDDSNQSISVTQYISQLKTWQLLLVILVTAAVARLINLGDTSIWYDEACSIFEARDVFYFISTENFIHPPLYYVMLAIWMKLSTSVWMLRFPSALFGVLSVYGMFRVGRHLLGSRVGLWAAGILAISPFHIYYAQQIKMYTLVTFLSTVSFLMFLKMLDDGATRKRLIWICVINTLFIYSSALSGLQIIAQTLWLFIHFRKRGRLIIPWILIHVLTVILFIPVMMWWSEFAGNMMSNSWVPAITLTTLVTSFKLFTSGFYATGWRMLGTVGVCTAGFLVGLFTLRKRRDTLLLLILMTFVPQMLIAAVSMSRGSIYLERTLIFMTIPLYLILAVGFASLRKQIVQFTVIVICIHTMFTPMIQQLRNRQMPFVNQTACPKMENQPVSHIIQAFWADGDVIAHTNVQSLLPCIYYMPVETYPQFHLMEEGETLDSLYDRDYAFYPKKKTVAVFDKFQITYQAVEYIVAGRNRVWLVASNPGVDERPSELTLYALDYMRTWGRITHEYRFLGVQLYLFEKHR